jgi:hypothetical protein
MGSLVMERAIRSERIHKFSLNGQASGVYLVKVTQGNKIGIGKLVLKDN